MAALPTPRRAAAAALVGAVLAALTLTAVPPGMAAPPPDTTTPQEGAGPGARERQGNYDSRDRALPSASGKQLGRTTADHRRLARRIGGQSLVSIDPLTGTPRNVGRLDGFLTAPSKASARTVALRYVRRHAAALGLQRADLSTLRLRRDYVDASGTHHLSWTQVVDGLPVFGNGLKAHVTRTGRLIALQGAPVAGTAAVRRVGDAPDLSAVQAREAAATDVGGTPVAGEATTGKRGTVTTWGNQDRASLTWFVSPSGLRLGWSTVVQAGGSLHYQHVIDAADGTVLYRQDLTAADRGDALVYKNYPGAPIGGTQSVVNLIDSGWLSPRARALSGPFTVAWADVADDNFPAGAEIVPVPGLDGGAAQYRLQPFDDAAGCPTASVCTWDPATPFSWAANLRADVTQGFYLTSMFHDYLLKSPIGFTRDAGNFEAVDGDPLLYHGLDGATSTGAGFPDDDHVDNANMATPPDGFSPIMQMYLFRAPGAGGAESPFPPVSSSFDPSVVLHEYVHGLSNRLVTDAQGNSTLRGLQARAMGEGWSDYYALDFLAARRLQPESSADGDAVLARYLSAGQPTLFRSMPVDCTVRSGAAACERPAVPGQSGPRLGGYTYGELAVPAGVAEEHGSGEVWAQTLWDLRKRLGRRVTNALTTRAMELAPADPSFLDMRNAMLQADLVVYGGRHRAAAWQVFADRGMGFFAGTVDTADTAPAEDFSPPPPPGTPTLTMRGRVTEGLSGAPLPNAVVAVGGWDSGLPGSYLAVTDTAGRYAIRGVYPGTYPKVSVRAVGHEILTRAVTVTTQAPTADFAPRLDWAASSAGGSVVDFNGPDYSAFGCGPEGLIDLSLATGWGSTTGDDQGTPTNTVIPKFAVLELAGPVSVTGFAIDPSATCGDAGSASTGDYRVEVSPNRLEWTTVLSGTFTPADRRLNELPLGEPVVDVRYVRVTLLSPQVPNLATNCPSPAFSGCAFLDMTELQVFGRG